jgi:uncharacterized protein (TIGR00661 family)
MKVLYGIQGTGNGHISRAMDIIPCLAKKVDLDILVSGSQSDIELQYPIKYRKDGLSFIFGKKGGIDLAATLARLNPLQFVRDVKDLPVHEYSLVISDFEPISAWSAKLGKIPSVSLSHQAAVLNKHAPKPEKKNLFGEFILKNYAPARNKAGFHFKSYGEGIYTPIIRQQIRRQEVRNENHITVYLPSYDDERIFEVLREFPDENWHVFSKYCHREHSQEKVHFNPLNSDLFTQSIAQGKAVICGAGFETPSEALFLGKKLLVVPMRNQYEQQCNARCLEEMGVPVIKSFSRKALPEISKWLETEQTLRIEYHDRTESIVNAILSQI